MAKHPNLRFSIGDKVFMKDLFSSTTVHIGIIQNIDKRRVRPYKISGRFWHYADDQLMLCMDPNTILKKMIAK